MKLQSNLLYDDIYMKEIYAMVKCTPAHNFNASISQSRSFAYNIHS